MVSRRKSAEWLVLALLAGAGSAAATPILDTSAPRSLSLYSLGTAPGVASHYSGVPYYYEGLAILGDNLLLSVGDPVSSVQTIWSLPLVRDSGHVVGLGGPTIFAQVSSDMTSLGNILAGGLVVTGQGLMYTTQGYSYVGSYDGSSASSTLLDVTRTGAYTGGMQNQPGGTPGQYKLSSVTGQWYTLTTSGGMGSMGIGSYTTYNVGVSAYAFDYVPANPTYGQARIILGDANRQTLDAYAVDAYGNPCNPLTNSSCAPVIHLVANNVALGYGVVRDPVSGDVLFTTANNDIWLLADSLIGEVPEPTSVLLGLSGLGLLYWRRRRLQG